MQVINHGGDEEGVWKGGSPCGSNMVEPDTTTHLLGRLLSVLTEVAKTRALDKGKEGV
jgi:hypothetical protein